MNSTSSGLRSKDNDIAVREHAIREKEKYLADAKRTLDQQVADLVEAQLKNDRLTITAEERTKAKQAAATDLERKAQELTELQAVLKQRDEKLAEAQNAQAELIKKQRELDLTVQKRIQEGLATIRQEAKKKPRTNLISKCGKKITPSPRCNKKSRNSSGVPNRARSNYRAKYWNCNSKSYCALSSPSI